jgi:hypothetical protein
MDITEHDWLGIAGLVVGIVGILLAIYFYHRSKRRVRISYTVDRTQLLGGHANVLPEEVSILYGGERIDNLTKDNMIVWNSGTESITRIEIMSPTLICLPDGLKLLKISLLKTSQSPSQFNLIVSSPFQFLPHARSGEGRQSVQLDFEYLEPKQGINIELLLTGGGGLPTLSGVILGMPRGFQRYVPEQTTNVFTITGYIMSLFGVLLTFIGALLFLFSTIAKPTVV